MTSVHPYLAWSQSKGLNFWGSAGYGQGKLEIADTAGNTTRADTRMLSLSAGVKGALSQVRGMSIKSDISLASTRIKDLIDDGGNLSSPAESINSQQLRVILAFERERALASGVLKPMLEIGTRYDGGDGDGGLGAVLGAGIHYANSQGLSMEGKVHALLGQKDYQEWGVQGTILQQAGTDGRGLSFSLSPSYGMGSDTGGSTRQVWQGVFEGNSADNSARLNMNIGYGLSARDGLLIPYSEITLGNARNYRLGLRWQHDSFDMQLSGEREESSSGTNNNSVLLETHIQF